MNILNSLKKLFSNPTKTEISYNLSLMSEDSLKIFAEAVGAKVLNTDSRTTIVSKVTKIISRS
jgi:hypothetical protein